MNIRQVLTALVGLAASANAVYVQAAGAKDTAVRIEVTGSPEVVFDWDREHCPTVPVDSMAFDIPDAPPRIFRDSTGVLHLFAGHFTNLALTGKTASRFTHPSCRSMMMSALDPDPSKFSDYEWLDAPYTLDGHTVYAIIHDEYHGWKYFPECTVETSRQYKRCWYTNLTYAISSDGGKTFSRVTLPDGLVARAPYPFSKEITRAGVHDPSNIFRNPADGAYYFLAPVEGYKEQARGTCLFRSPDLKPGTWRAWDGVGFNAKMVGPYNETRQRNAPSTCTPVIDIAAPLWNATFNTSVKQFIAVGRNAGGVAFRASADLIHWSRAYTIMPSLMPNQWRPGAPAPTRSFALIDPDSPSRNFDVTGGAPYLYYIKWHISGNHIVTSARDIERVQVRVTSAK